MSKVFPNPFIYDIVPKTNDIEVAKSIVVHNEIVVGLVRSLEELKTSSSVAKLATKMLC
jgi:hypothetical protein